jgi:hypothetical protein
MAVDAEKGASIISKIDAIGNKIFPLVIVIIGILGITGNVPKVAAVASEIFVVVLAAALEVWNILFPSEKVAAS